MEIQSDMNRLYQNVSRMHFSDNRQMLFFAGPRQVGKTVIAESLSASLSPYHYLNWDRRADKTLIIGGEDAVADEVGLNTLSASKGLIVFDELHKYPHWKNFLKGFFDTYQDKAHILVTGSARMDVFRQGADSLLGRYFPYRIHPLSVREMSTDDIPDSLISMPSETDENVDLLFEFGGFPEPLTKQSGSFSRQWNRLRENLLFKEDIRDLTNIRDIELIQHLALMLKESSGSLVNMTSFAKKLQVSVTTIKRWLSTLEAFYYCYQIRPWSHSIARSLIKEPKVYLWNWADVKDDGARAENMIASHLLKAVHFWTDSGQGDFNLYFIRTKEKKEVDFLVTKDNKPWFLVEVKLSNNKRLSSSLAEFQKVTGAEHAFQVVIDMPYVDQDCFANEKPVIVPARTFLSQLV